jgi:transcriptional/translational regulatory protein YebC/TACO1
VNVFSSNTFSSYNHLKSYVSGDDGIFTFFTEPTEFYAVKTNLVKIGYSVTESNLEFLPVSRVSLSENDLQLVSALHQKIDENSDVIKIYDNIE